MNKKKMKKLELIKTIFVFVLICIVVFCQTTTVMASTSNEAMDANQIIVVLDPGHGGVDTGTSRTYNGVTYYERDIVLKITEYCKEELSKYPYVKVYMTRGNNTNANISIEQRVQMAKAWNADIFVSFHINSTDAKTTSANGVEIYYPNTNYNIAISNEGKKLADDILSQLVNIGLTNRGTIIKNAKNDKYPNGTAADYLGVIRYSKMNGFPGVLIEHGFINNTSDFQSYFSSDAQLKQLGIADATGIMKYVDANLHRWIQDENGWKCYLGDAYFTNQWKQIKGKWYYLNWQGYRFTGIHTIGGYMYHFNDFGQMSTGWILNDGKWYFADENGRFVKGWLKLSNDWYYLRSNGEMVKGWQCIAGKWYYFVPSGEMQTGWSYVNGNWYYLDANGVMKTGWEWMNNHWYLMHEDGHMLTGLQNINGKQYYLASSGEMQQGWQQIDSIWYYFMPIEGSAHTGWLYEGNKWYYLNEQGEMQTGWVNINGIWYYMELNGAWVSNPPEEAPQEI